MTLNFDAETRRTATLTSQQNSRLRAEWKQRVLAGEITAVDYIFSAVHDERLRNLSLAQLLSTQADTSYKKARAIVRATHRYAGYTGPVDYRKMTVAWLVSDWSKGRRWEAFLGALRNAREAQGPPDAPYNYGEATLSITPP